MVCFKDTLWELRVGKGDLQAAVNYINANLAGTTAANGSTIPHVILPPNYRLGVWFYDQDVRLTKEFKVKERYTLSVFTEVFNVLNISNIALSGLGINSLSANPATQSFTLGQASSRVLQTFGSGGPRAIQFGARISF